MSATSKPMHTASTPVESMEASFYVFPDVLADWPYKRKISPHYRAAQEESGKWLESLKPFSPGAQKVFNQCDFSLLSALTLPQASHDVLRSYCDLMHTFFVLDEYTDVANNETTRLICECTMDAILNPDKTRPQDESVIGEISRQFWKRASACASQATRERFFLTWRSYIDAVIEQASRRDNSRYICTLEEYIIARRDNIGSYPCFAFLEMTLDLEIPHHIMEHPTIIELQRDTTDMILLLNDIASYKKEILADDADYNSVTVVMHNNKVNIHDAIEFIHSLHDQKAKNFLKLRDEVKRKHNFPDCGEHLNHQIEAYVDGLGNWVRGNEEWIFGTKRYFGDEGQLIKDRRKVIIEEDQ